MPTLFVSHGAPSFALQPGLLGPRLTELGRSLPRPRAVLVVSPHWSTHDVQVTHVGAPETMYDFGGFEDELYALHYPAPGAPELADQTVQLLNESGWQAALNERRGLDHGAWIPLRYIYPDAEIPVVQVSMPRGLDQRAAYALGQALAPLRSQGVLIVGSGGLTHNLREFRGPAMEAGASYVREFAEWVRKTLMARDHERLVRTLQLAPHAQRAHPTTEHLVPLMFAAGAAGAKAAVTPIDGGVTHGVLAMDSFVFGGIELLQ